MEIRPLAETDLDEADRIFRLAFGTFLNLPDPMQFSGDSDYVRTRFKATPNGAFGAYEKDELIGANFLTRWGAYGFFGPICVRPDYWNKGVAQQLLAPTMQRFEEWGVPHVALFTFAESTKHVGLYQKFDLWPQRLTALMTKPVARRALVPTLADWEAQLPACRALTETISPGLDLTSEIQALKEQGLGEIVFVEDKGLAGFAVLHCGGGSEAGSDTAYVKFAAARDDASFTRLLAAVEAASHARGLGQLMAGVNTARSGAYRALLDQGFRTAMQGVAMQKGDAPTWNRPDCFVLDDWR